MDMKTRNYGCWCREALGRCGVEGLHQQINPCLQKFREEHRQREYLFPVTVQPYVSSLLPHTMSFQGGGSS